jgi:hypothetical protein
MKTSHIRHDVHTKEYSVYCEERICGKEFIAEAFVKGAGHVRHMVNLYFHVPTVTEILFDATKFSVHSPRPYKAGQSCDGSITSPVLHLYFQCCSAFNLNPIECYRQAYNDISLTRKDIQSIIAFATWQGVEIITDWNTDNIERVLDSLTKINNHSLRSVLEEKLALFSHH